MRAGNSYLALLRSTVMSLSQIRLAGVGARTARERIDNAASPERERAGAEVNSKLIYLNPEIDEVRSG